MKVVGSHRPADYLAGLAGLAAGVAAVAGFLPGLYRDPENVVDQAHGYDLGNLVAVLVLEIALFLAARGSMRGRLIATGALGCLFYNYVTYAFDMVVNPATLLYIAVLAFSGWSFLTGFARVEDAEVETLVEGRLARRTTSTFLVILALLFGANWLTQIGGSAISGKLPADLVVSGWPMNPIYVLDLGFVLPLGVITAVRLARHQPGGARLAVPFLVFVALLAVSILLMVAVAGSAGQVVDVAMVAIFVAALIVGATLAVFSLR
jgi:hypothetical protein